MNPMTPEVQAAVERWRDYRSGVSWRDYRKTYSDDCLPMHDAHDLADAYLALLPPGPRPAEPCQGNPCVHQGWCIIDGEVTECPTDDFRQDSWHTRTLPLYSSKARALLAAWHDAHEAYLRQVEGFRKGLA